MHTLIPVRNSSISLRVKISTFTICTLWMHSHVFAPVEMQSGLAKNKCSTPWLFVCTAAVVCCSRRFCFGSDGLPVLLILVCIILCKTSRPSSFV